MADSDPIKVTPSELRAYAAKLEAAATALEGPHKAGHKAMAAALAEDIASFTRDKKPAPIYSSTSHIKDAFTRQGELFDHAIASARNIAKMLRDGADVVEHNEKKASEGISAVDLPTLTV